LCHNRARTSASATFSGFATSGDEATKSIGTIPSVVCWRE